MTEIDRYLKRAHSALKTNNSRLIDETAREIVSAFQAEIPRLSKSGVWFSGDPRVPYLYTAEDLKKLIGKLRVFRDRQDRELYDSYGFSTITDSIRQLEDALVDELSREKLLALYKRIDALYASKYKENYTSGLYEGGDADEEPSDEKTQLRLEKLRLLRDEKLENMRLAEQQDRSQTINVNTYNQANAHNHTDLDLNISVNQTLEHVDALPDEILSKEDKAKLKELIEELEQAVGDKNIGKKKFEKLQSWLADKGSDVSINLLLAWIVSYL